MRRHGAPHGQGTVGLGTWGGPKGLACMGMGNTGRTPWPRIHGEGGHRAPHSQAPVGQGTKGTSRPGVGTRGLQAVMNQQEGEGGGAGPGATPGGCIHLLWCPHQCPLGIPGQAHHCPVLHPWPALGRALQGTLTAKPLFPPAIPTATLHPPGTPPVPTLHPPYAHPAPPLPPFAPTYTQHHTQLSINSHPAPNPASSPLHPATQPP